MLTKSGIQSSEVVVRYYPSNQQIMMQQGPLLYVEPSSTTVALLVPKSKNSLRTISLPLITQAALNKRDMSGDWMLPSRAGTNLRYHTFISYHWRPLCVRACVPYESFHTCRH